MKKYSCFALLTVFLSLSSSSILNAQTDSVEVKIDTSKVENPISISCDLMSRYVWRGTDFGGSPSIQPGIEYNIAGFTIGAWGAYTLNSSGAQEADIYAGYTYKEMLSLTFTDYFFPDELTDYNYFDYVDSTTGHILEATLAFKGPNKFPLSVLVASNFYGADAKKINSDGTTGTIQYSSYAELTYSFDNLDIFLGANLTAADMDRGESGFYGDYLGIVNMGITTTKDLSYKDKFSIPLSVSLITNPQAQKIFLVGGFSF